MRQDLPIDDVFAFVAVQVLLRESWVSHVLLKGCIT